MSKKFAVITLVVVLFSIALSACGGTQTTMLGINASSRTEGCDFGQMALVEHDFRALATDGVLDMTVDSYLDSIMPKFDCIK